MYHQPIKLPFSKLCKSVELCIWLTLTLLHQFEPVLLFETLFSFYFQCYIQNIFFLFDNVNVWNKNFWKLKNLFLSILKANLSNRVHFNETCMNKWMSMSISIQVTSRLLPRMICGQWQEWKNRMKKMENENKKLAKLKTRKGGSCKSEIDNERQVTISGKSPSPLGASAAVNDRLHQKLLYLWIQNFYEM